MKLIAESSIITNSLHYVDGAVVEPIIGGAGLYALTGMLLWHRDSAIAAKVGPDFEAYYGAFFDANGLSRDLLDNSLPHCVFEELHYRPNGSYEPRFRNPGEGYGGRLSRDKLEHIMEVAAAVYFCGNPGAREGEDSLRQQIELAGRHGVKLMWEFVERSDLHPSPSQIERSAAQVEMFSINYNECSNILGVSDEDSVLRWVRSLETPLIVYRCGERGLYIVRDHKSAFIPALRAAQSEGTDPTGCGNSSTGAAMAAYMHGDHPVMCGIKGNISAYYNAQQHGPFLAFNDALRREAQSWADALFAQYDGERQVFLVPTVR